MIHSELFNNNNYYYYLLGKVSLILAGKTKPKYSKRKKTVKESIIANHLSSKFEADGSCLLGKQIFFCTNWGFFHLLFISISVKYDL